MAERQQIGTVEITRERIYRLDPAGRDGDPLATTVVVRPGTYPVYRDGLSRYWQMTGTVNHLHYRMGDGMFAMNSGDVPSEDEVTFYSMRLGPDEWAEMLAGFESAPDPALVFSLMEAGPDLTAEEDGVHVDWRMTRAEWDELRAAIKHSDAEYCMRLDAEGKLDG